MFDDVPKSLIGIVSRPFFKDPFGTMVFLVSFFNLILWLRQILSFATTQFPIITGRLAFEQIRILSAAPGKEDYSSEQACALR